MQHNGIAAVTGASGHVGGNLVRALLARGQKVRVLVRHDTRAVQGLEVEIVRGDVCDAAALRRLVAGASTTYHLAAHISIVSGEDELLRRVNVEGTRNLVEACLEADGVRLVHFSSVHALDPGDPRRTVFDESRPFVDPQRALPYDCAKADGEREVLRGLTRGLDAIILSPAAVLGPHDYKPSAMGQVLLDIYHHRLPALVAGGFDWVDVRDVAQTALVAAERARRGERYILSGHYVPFAGLADLVQKTTGARPPRLVAPLWLARVGAPFISTHSRLVGRRPLFTRESLHVIATANQRMSHEKASRELGHAPRPLSETIVDAFTWFRQTGAL